MEKKHALVIGGTGMLSDVTLWFAEHGYVVSVIGRNGSRHETLRAKSNNPESINSLKVDYEDLALLENLVRDAVDEHGPISCVVSWTPALYSLELVSRIISEKSHNWKLYQVMGSRRYFEENKLKVTPRCQHRSIYLGFVIEHNHSRWLTDEEIAGGVIESLEEDREASVIGVLHPYEKRPGY